MESHLKNVYPMVSVVLMLCVGLFEILMERKPL